MNKQSSIRGINNKQKEAPMKRTLLLVFSLALVALFFAPSGVSAQTPDTLVLPANPGGTTFDLAIKADPGWGVNPKRVYVLQQTGSLDTVYFVSANFNVTKNLTIIGKPNPVTGMLPIIAPGFDASGASPTRLFQPNVTGVKLTVKNVYMSEKNLNGVVTTTGFGSIYVTGDSVTLTLDHCVLDGNGPASFIYLNAKWDKTFITNTELRNCQNPTVAGGFVHAGGAVPMDTMLIQNCTMFCNNGNLVSGPGYRNYLNFQHNTVFFGGNGLTPTGITNAVIRNNIFYSLAFRGADTNSYAKQTYEGSYTGNSVIGLDSLTATITGSPYNMKEASRNIRIENNAYFWPPALYSYVASLKTDTGTTVVPPVWMNKRVTSMFSNKTQWPLCVAINNQNTDPGFNSALVNLIVDSAKVYVNNLYHGGSSSLLWGPYRDDPLSIYLIPGHTVPSNWAKTQGYPVPENLRYTNTALQHGGTDGKALGDLNWFPEQGVTAVEQPTGTLPTEYALSNNYPNPFNPTTQIEYAVPKNGLVTLKVYNVLGQNVATLFSGMRAPGQFVATFDGTRLTSGVYFYTLEAGGVTISKKLMLLK